MHKFIPCSVYITRALLSATLGVFLVTSTVWAERSLYPVALMNWMVEGSFHALIVDKSQQRLSVWLTKNGEPRNVESYRCATGENPGDKWVRGDMKTPEGVYFFCSLIDGSKLPPKYGLWAFTTDYPNFVDRRSGKNGDGIWLHGRDKPLSSRPDSNGCIALMNSDLLKVSKFVRLQGTPMIVVKNLKMAPRARIIEQEREIRDFIESWRQAWESRDIDRYMAHYSPNFQSSWLDFAAWKSKKLKLTSRYSKIRVRFGNIYLYRQDGLVTAIFTQSYRSESFSSTGIKILYLKEQNGYHIYSEDYHELVDDSFPVRTLLAQYGSKAAPEADKKGDFSIRLVSTDEPDRSSRGGIEDPSPSAPSRGVVLEKMSPVMRNCQVPLEMNEKGLRESRPDRLMIAMRTHQFSITGETSPTLAHRSQARSHTVVARKKFESTRTTPSRTATGSTVSDLPKSSKRIPTKIPAAYLEILHNGKKEFDKEQVVARATPRAAPLTNRTKLKQKVNVFLSRWKAAWEQKNLDRYMKMYHADFQQGTLTYKGLRKSKKRFFNKYRIIRVELEQVSTKKTKRGLKVSLLQTFRGDDYSDKGWKSMVLAEGKNRDLQIVSEHWCPVRGASSDSNPKSP
jgi:murein L,D-transpeptidase YafK